MARPKEIDEEWKPTRVNTTIPMKFYKMCLDNRWGFNDVFRDGIMARLEPTQVQKEMLILRSRLDTALRILEKKGYKIN